MDSTEASVDWLRRRAHSLIPGGCHTAAKGDDQFPSNAPAFISRGEGCHIWDTEGREFIEYAPGLRAVTLGHAYPAVVDAACDASRRGNNFNRPSVLEGDCAEVFLDHISNMDMVKFTKDGSTVMTAAVKLARAYTGRKRVALCASSPFFSYDDWFIGTTAIDSGVPDVVKSLSCQFDYNAIDTLAVLFDDPQHDIACVVLEPARTEEPRDDFLARVRALCDRHGAILILDETVTGFRWHNKGAQHVYKVVPDLCCFGKAMANGFSVSALAGRRDIMELGGIRQTTAERVFLLSTTHGAEIPSLAAAIATMCIYRDEPVIGHLYRMGRRLSAGFTDVVKDAGVEDYISIVGRDCCLYFQTRSADMQPSQSYRTLFLQELIAHGVLAPSLMTTYSHTEADIDRTIEAVRSAAIVYARALTDGVDNYLIGPPSAPVYRKHNDSRWN